MGRYDGFKQPVSRVKPIIVFLIVIIIVFAAVYYFINRYEESKKSEIKTQKEISLQIPKKQSGLKDENATSTEISSSNDSQKDPSVGNDFSAEPVVELPLLEESDPVIKEDLIQLSAGLEDWLNAEGLIKKYLIIINDFSQGQRPYKHFRFLKLKEPFKVKKDRQGLFIDPKSYQRYDGLAAAVNQLDTQAGLKVYNRYKPLLQQAFDEFGYPEEHKLDDIVKKAIAKILAASVIEGRIGLVKPSVRYKFADKKLESLDPVQKQMIRMGPYNTLSIQNKLRQFAQALSQQE